VQQNQFSDDITFRIGQNLSKGNHAIQISVSVNANINTKKSFGTTLETKLVKICEISGSHGSEYEV
jgi:hypothetical protein